VIARSRPLATLVVALTFLVAGCGVPPARVATPANNDMQFFMPMPCPPDAPQCPRLVYGIGDIALHTPGDFLAFLAAHPEAASTTIGIILDSRGGSVLAGLQLGDAIRRNGWNTFTGTVYPVPGERRTAGCLSACVWAFAGGVNRFVVADGVIGVHRFYGEGDIGSAQAMTAYINLYLDRMGVSRALQDVASLTPGNTITYLTTAEAVRFHLAYITPELERAMQDLDRPRDRRAARR
jgi:hypothetical protein